MIQLSSAVLSHFFISLSQHRRHIYHSSRNESRTQSTSKLGLKQAIQTTHTSFYTLIGVPSVIQTHFTAVNCSDYTTSQNEKWETLSPLQHRTISIHHAWRNIPTLPSHKSWPSVTYSYYCPNNSLRLAIPRTAHQRHRPPTMIDQ